MSKSWPDLECIGELMIFICIKGNTFSFSSGVYFIAYLFEVLPSIV